MTKQEEKQIIRIYGPNYEEEDIPAYIRERDFKQEMETIEALERKAEEVGEETKNEK